MSRRSKPEKREIIPDARFQSVTVQAFINRVNRRGKKSVAARIVYDALDLIEDRTKRNPLEVFEQALKNISPGDGSKATTCRWSDLPDSDGSSSLPANGVSITMDITSSASSVR
jgi:hypothetical protein